jgi:hypothetical protein
MRLILGVVICACFLCGCGGGDNMRTDPSKYRGEGLAPSTKPGQASKVGLPPITPD